MTTIPFALLLGLATQRQAGATQILQINREPIKPESEAKYREIEEETARLAVKLGCPHPYLAAESLTGPKEIWWFNGYDSPVEPKQVAEDYAKNAPWTATLKRNSQRKASLTGQVVEVFTHYRPALSAGDPWSPGQGRFLVITVVAAKEQQRASGTVFEADDGTKFIVTRARTRKEADALAAAADPTARVLAVRPSFSFPAKEWVAADPEFWK